jgi:hypothetical protein
LLKAAVILLPECLAPAPFMQEFLVGTMDADIVKGQARIVQQAMRQMEAVYTTADDQHLEHCRISSL